MGHPFGHVGIGVEGDYPEFAGCQHPRRRFPGCYRDDSLAHFPACRASQIVEKEQYVIGVYAVQGAVSAFSVVKEKSAARSPGLFFRAIRSRSRGATLYISSRSGSAICSSSTVM